MRFVFYDFEVFSNDWMVVLIEENRGITQKLDNEGKKYKLHKTFIANNFEDMILFYQEHKNDIWVGYNCNHYDQYILKGILCGIQPFLMNDWIITQGRNGWEFDSDVTKYKLNSYDVYNMVSDGGGLKALESSMGLNIKESSVPFDIPRKLTAEELAEVEQYCTWDVFSTRKVFYYRYDTFETCMGVVNLINWERDKPDMSLISKSETQLTAIMLDAKKPKYPRTDEFEFKIHENLLKIKKYRKVVDWYAPENRKYTVWDEQKKKMVKNQLLIDIAGTPHVFGYGGLHGSKDKYFYICKEDEIIICADVSSYYPSYLIKYHSLSRNVKDPRKYEQIYKQRLKHKAEGNKLQKAEKLVLNKTSGGMKAESSQLYDPRQNNQMCVSCQLFLLDLAEHLELAEFEDFILLQSNTDAVYFKVKKKDKEAAIAICKEWMERTDFELEFTECTKIYQKDVNNYLMVKVDGGIKVKGAYVKEQTELSRDLPVVRTALIEYMTKGTPVEDTIKGCNQLIEFILTTKASSKYLGAMYGDKMLNERCNRVFASLREEDKGKGIFKISKATGKPNKFSNSPESCFIDNGEIIGKEAPEYLDKEFYIRLCIKRLKDFGIEYKRADGVVYDDEKKKGNSREQAWNDKYKLVKVYLEQGGTLKGKIIVEIKKEGQAEDKSDSERAENIESINLTSWVQTQKKNFKSGKLDEVKAEKLREIGFFEKMGL